MMVSDQPVPTRLDQNHAKSSQRFFNFAVSNRAERIESGHVSDIVTEHDDLAIVDRDPISALCQACEIASDGVASFLVGEVRRSEENSRPARKYLLMHR